MANLIDLKLPKKTKKEQAEADTLSTDDRKYPYGTRITFDEETIPKIPVLSKLKINEKVTITGVGEVNEIGGNERQEAKPARNISIQIQKINIAQSADKELAEGFKEATKKE